MRLGLGVAPGAWGEDKSRLWTCGSLAGKAVVPEKCWCMVSQESASATENPPDFHVREPALGRHQQESMAHAQSCITQWVYLVTVEYPLCLSVAKSSPQSTQLKQTESTATHWKALAEVVEVGEYHYSQQGDLQLPPESCWDSSPIFVPNKLASQHTWQAPRWIGKPK